LRSLVAAAHHPSSSSSSSYLGRRFLLLQLLLLLLRQGELLQGELLLLPHHRAQGGGNGMGRIKSTKAKTMALPLLLREEGLRRYRSVRSSLPHCVTDGDIYSGLAAANWKVYKEALVSLCKTLIKIQLL
jgi:hypothetical protein